VPETPLDALLLKKKISEIINPRLVQAPADLPLTDVLHLMKEQKSGYVVLTEKQKPVGIFTEVDVTRRVLLKHVNFNEPILCFMTKNPQVLTLEDSVGKAIKFMSQHNFYHIPLVDAQSRLVGMISVRSLIRFLAEFYPTEIYNLPPDPDQIMGSQEGG